ncbi:unnamed protein product [Cylicocyclus nassatus]|uniref:Uncharacterized protein n=1 Tax=Cylicocyclus nassatus TaxID=53992 RepID=A0AA36GTN8_CYLNA|nr:unnamed protein product [Cylicocyclus nassatus]
MFSFVPVVLLVAIIARTQALECYNGVATGYSPLIKQLCPPDAKYCYSLRQNNVPTIYGCGNSALCKGKGCRTLDYRTVCCCASDLCNRS